MKTLSTFCLFFLYLNCFGQTPTQEEKIQALLDTYFLDDREIIHVQFNKNLYLNNEDIAFKGYIFSKNNNAPHQSSTNIQLVIYNEQQEVVQKQLLYAANGMFSGGVHLNKTFKSGKYLFHFYTNWMNNFKEDDSFSQIIEIHNINEPFSVKGKKPNYKTAQISFFPEGGSIIDGINNSIGVKITDCNNKGIELKDIQIFDSKSNEVSHLNTNKMGNGVFYLMADRNEKYTLKIQSNELTLNQNLPEVKTTGIAISYNNNLPNNKLAIAVKTNEKGLEQFQNKKFDLLIQQNGYSVLKPINFDNKQNEQIVLIDKKYLQNGVNSLRLIDENLNEVTERLIYNYDSSQANLTINAKAVVNDSIVLNGFTKLLKANISTCILPEKNISSENKRSILGTFYLNTYIENPEIDNYTYFDPENKNSKRDMDALMHVQSKSKLLWENIKSNPPKLNYAFNKGVTISGTIKNNINTNEINTLSMISIKNKVFENINVEKDKSFKLDNFFVQDSTAYVFQLENERKQKKFTELTAKVINHQTDFNLPLRFIKTKCAFEKIAKDSLVFSNFKLLNNEINLEEVVIKAEKKIVFTHNNGISPSAIPHKISDREVGTILDFIGRNGFRTGVYNNEAYIRGNRDSFSGGSPEVFLDNILLFDFNILFDLDIDNVDEIYIDKTGIGSVRQNSTGSIKIFLKRGKENSQYITKNASFIATGGFSKIFSYKNSIFFSPKEFDAFGTLYWTANTKVKENEIFQMKFPKGNQTVIDVLIEGFSEDGQLISVIKKIPVSPL